MGVMVTITMVAHVYRYCWTEGLSRKAPCVGGFRFEE